MRLEAKGSGLGTEVVGMLFTVGRIGLHGATVGDGALPAFKFQIIPFHIPQPVCRGHFPHPRSEQGRLFEHVLCLLCRIKREAASMSRKTGGTGPRGFEPPAPWEDLPSPAESLRRPSPTVSKDPGGFCTQGNVPQQSGAE